MRIATTSDPRKTDTRIVQRLLMLTALLLVGGGVATFVNSYRQSHDNSTSTAAQPAALVPDVSPTDTYITRLQTKLRLNANDADSFAQLGAAYLQKVRETGDPSYYTKAQDVLNQAFALDPQNPDTLRGQASLALARHDFQRGLELGQQALAIDPDSPQGYGVVGDALTELGRYDEAVATLQKMIDLKPDLSSYARMSYARELHGDIVGAKQAMQRAVDAGGPTGESAAWARLQLGNLYYNYGDIDAAEQQYNSSLAAFPGYVHGLAGLAKVRAARGDTSGAITVYRQVVDRYPVLEYVVALGDLDKKAGNEAEATKQYALAGAIDQLLHANGVDSDLETALFYADHDERIDDALRQARAEYARRPSVLASDILGWTLYKSGQYQEALKYSNEARRLGGKDALMAFHAGMIRAKLGDSAGARTLLAQALDTNPHFSLLYVDVAKDTLRQLTAASRPWLRQQHYPPERLPALDVLVGGGGLR